MVQALGTREIGTRDPAEVLKRSARRGTRPTPLLDNFEQVLDAAPLLTDSTESCARLKVLVTQSGLRGQMASTTSKCRLSSCRLAELDCHSPS